MKKADYEHKPVLLSEVSQGLNIHADGCYIDCTFGRGGHSAVILQHLSKRGKLFAFDKDPSAIASANEMLKKDVRCVLIHGSYKKLKEVMENYKMVGKVNGIVFDLGVSSPQLDDPSRGFSFSKKGKLDMRMDSSSGITAAEWLSNANESEISEILWNYGEERFARQIAKKITDERKKNPLETTQQLADLISDVVTTKERGQHPATRSFQAIRIFINHELDELKSGLLQTIDVLVTGGRLLVISFHSLEDRIVKRFIRDECRGDHFPDYLPVSSKELCPRLKRIGKTIRPSSEEIRMNPRARSAVLRIAEKIAT